MQNKPAKGTKGILITVFDNPIKYVFRVNDDNGGFIDYDIFHYDIDMIIDDDSAIFMEQDGKHYIDYDLA